MELKDIKIGSPYLFNSTVYGRTAVHVTAIYNGLVHFSIDGGEASRQVRDFPELFDGKYFAIPERIEKRSSVKNTIREVPGVGKVAVVTFTPPTPPKLSRLPSAEQVRNLSAQEAADLAAKMNAPLVKSAEALELPKERRPKRLSLAQAHVQARKMADRNPTFFKWAVNTDAPAITLADKLRAMTYKGLRQYARDNYSTIGKLTKTADIIAAILAIESKNNEVTF